MKTIGIVITGLGTIFLVLGNLGVLRLPDVYNRIQAGTKATTLGAFLTIIGVGIMEPTFFWKALLIALFILVTNPISSHAIARASYKSGISLCDKSVVDKTNDFGN
jgi:multicomponent Na+:H+ antiporter subunit G